MKVVIEQITIEELAQLMTVLHGKTVQISDTPPVSAKTDAPAARTGRVKLTAEQKRERQKEYQRKWYEKNKKRAPTYNDEPQTDEGRYQDYIKKYKALYARRKAAKGV